MYQESDLVCIGKRENNKKRNYLVVNKLQGKHIPVSPSKALGMFDALADILKEKYSGKKLLLVGFAETATAIGAEIAIKLGAYYIQTTREIIDNVSYLFFSEAHSHATEQKLVKEDIEKFVREVEHIIFIEDEVTTGNTILNIVNILEDTYGSCVKKKFAVASLLNGMSDEQLTVYNEHDIKLYYLAKIDNSRYSAIAAGYDTDGTYFVPDFKKKYEITQVEFNGWLNSRRAVDAEVYGKHCMKLWNDIQKKIDFKTGSSILVVGTEEFMYPALFIGSCIEKKGCTVRSHSTTRSPIEVCQGRNLNIAGLDEKNIYPVHERYELRSLYDDERKTFIYDIDSYDKVLILTDSHYGGSAGVNSLVNALSKKNDDIYLLRWIV